MKQLAQIAAFAPLLLGGNALAADSCPIGYQRLCPEGPRNGCICARWEAAVYPHSGSTDLSSTAVTNETWRNTSAQPGDKWTGQRPAVYTYVLAGDVGHQADYPGTDARVAKARENLAALVREVRAFDESNPAAPDAARSNLFLVPTTKGGKTPKEAPYDFQLASTYRSALTSLMATRTELTGRLAGMGPFLVATRMPVGELPAAASAGTPGNGSNGPNTHILLIDLSDAEPKSIIVFVRTFQDEIRKDDLKADRELAHLRATVASALLAVNDAVPFIATAYAEARAIVGGESNPDSTDAAKSPKAPKR